MKEAGTSGWREDDSREFLDYGEIFVPDRAQQIDTICRLVPPAGEGGLVVELCCGAGLLSAALLDRHPGIRVLALDGSAEMRAATQARLAPHTGRFTVGAFDLAAAGWRSFDEAPAMVVSSLAVHHLDGPGKQRLFADMATALRSGGALIIADLIAPASPAGVDLAARAWQAATERQAAAAGRPGAVRRFRELDWNFYADPDPDPIDQPSPLLDQLLWMRAAGLVGVDVFWMQAGHAVYGGFKPV
jgi:tRNA (cmo5U34)-methyltransferase